MAWVGAETLAWIGADKLAWLVWLILEGFCVKFAGFCFEEELAEIGLILIKPFEVVGFVLFDLTEAFFEVFTLAFTEAFLDTFT